MAVDSQPRLPLTHRHAKVLQKKGLKKGGFKRTGSGFERGCEGDSSPKELALEALEHADRVRKRLGTVDEDDESDETSSRDNETPAPEE